jgi:hypothetical protein
MVMPNALIVVDVCNLVLFVYTTLGETGVVNVDLLD